MMNYNNPYQPNAYGYGVPRPQARNTQPLTQEQITKLRQNPSTFDMKVEPEDLWKAACTHKEKTGASTLLSLGGNRYRCTICGKEFNMADISKNEVEESVNNITDIIQTIKTIYLDASEGLISGYSQIIPLLEKLPALWERAIGNFEIYDNPAATVNPMGVGYANGFGTLQTLLTNPYGGYAPQPGYMAPQQPNYGYNAGYAPQPGYMAPQQPNYGYMPPVQQVPDMTGNPMAYGAPGAPVAQPVAPAPGVMPGGVQPAPVAPAAAPANNAGEVKQQQTFNV